MEVKIIKKLNSLISYLKSIMLYFIIYIVYGTDDGTDDGTGGGADGGTEANKLIMSLKAKAKRKRINTNIDEYFKLEETIFDAFGYVEDFKRVQDLRLYEWCCNKNKLYFSTNLKMTYKVNTCYVYNLNKKYSECASLIMLSCGSDEMECVVILDKKKKKDIKDIS